MRSVLVRALACLIVLAAVPFSATCVSNGLDKQRCVPNEIVCKGATALRCTGDGTGYAVFENCARKQQICTTLGCRACVPNEDRCVGAKLLSCNTDGTAFLPTPKLTCDLNKGDVCFRGGCVNACDLARQNRSYVGCEYWAVDLDNAVVSSGNAAAQQFAIALSNASEVEAEVIVTAADADKGAIVEIKKVSVPPGALEVLLLPAREVDGSPKGEFNTGTGSAISKAAYKVESSVPIVVYQFNPLSNVGVFSNDASLLIPVSGLTLGGGSDVGAPYLVMGWPQTIAITNDPGSNFGSTDLRAFLTVVATRDATTIKVDLKTRIIPDGDRIGALNAGDQLVVKLDAYDVLNLETGGFGADADFTGSTVESDKPVVVFSGSEASDVPDPVDLTFRRCCADHLEQQLFPQTTLGRTFIALTTPLRSEALKGAGASIEVTKQKEYFRVLAGGEFAAITTNLPAPNDKLNIGARNFVRLDVERDFVIQSTQPLVVGQFVASQFDVGIPAALPGGDPSFILLPPVEQYRTEYLFLTPDKYAFDFIMIAAPKSSTVWLDDRELVDGCDELAGKKLCCKVAPVGAVKVQTVTTDFVSYKCQLSFPIVREELTPPANLAAGSQNDGVHRLKATDPVGLVVYGFDNFVSYGYPGGTDLSVINIE